MAQWPKPGRGALVQTRMGFGVSCEHAASSSPDDFLFLCSRSCTHRAEAQPDVPQWPKHRQIRPPGSAPQTDPD
eukprot:859051-Lingulodinium_polyedra.AAC.1